MKSFESLNSESITRRDFFGVPLLAENISKFTEQNKNRHRTGVTEQPPHPTPFGFTRNSQRLLFG